VTWLERNPTQESLLLGRSRNSTGKNNCRSPAKVVDVKQSITKAGNRRTRSLLVEAAWAVVRRGKRPEWAPLRAWVEKIAARRGKCIAVVALARKLAGYLYAMMRDGTEFDPSRCGQRTSVAVGA